ncbi:MAG: OadG family protein [Clostridia bacterium]|nr:OadG family protein [Clostridia bacterium]
MKKVLCILLSVVMLLSLFALTICAEAPQETAPTVEETQAPSVEEAQDDLGGIFSAERWAYSGEMLVLGMGMIFLVLGILWGILAIFAKSMGGAEKPAKEEKLTPKVESKPVPAPVAPAAPVAAPTSDDAIVAAITAAIAMTIESDPALSSQFKSGFRVVSFQKKSGKTSWNH